MLKIYRSKQSAFIVGFIGLSIFAFGALFLYLNFLSPYDFYRIVAIISVVLSLIVLWNAFNFSKIPLIVGLKQGIQLNISLFGKSIFIPWEGVSQVGVELKDPLPTWGSVSGRPYTKCLLIEIDGQYLKRLPKFLKGVLKAQNRIYFSSLSLLTDDAKNALLALKNKSSLPTLTHNVVKQNKLPDLILLLMLVFSGAISFGVDYSVIQLIGSSNKFFIGAGKVIDIIARAFGTGNIKLRTPQEKYEMALFFVPFAILAVLSFVIYFKFLKGKIKDE